MTVSLANDDEKWMRKALALARRGEGITAPNPPVGAVIVCRGREIGSGFHRKAGGPHAELAAIESAGSKVKGATLYVTLEPCSTWGKTGPCTAAIIDRGIARVVVAVRDPNPRHSGKGLRELTKAGVEVCKGVCFAESSRLIAPFSKWITTGRPYLTLKMGMSLDGKIADSSGKSKWITCAKSRQFVRDLRRRVDAILIGRRTACIDNPSLQCRPTRADDPYRVIVDSAGSVPLHSNVLNGGNIQKTIIATTERCSRVKRNRYKRKGARAWKLPLAAGRVSLPALFLRLGKTGVLHVLCEGGGELAYELIRTRLVDECLFFCCTQNYWRASIGFRDFGKRLGLAWVTIAQVYE